MSAVESKFECKTKVEKIEQKEILNIFNIGIDFGGVLSIHDTEADTKTGHRSTLVNVEGAVDALKKLKSLGHRLYLISFCGKSRAIETAAAIQEQISNLFTHLFFVKDKKFKKNLVRSIGCHVMIDDTIDIINDIDDQKLDCELIWFTGDPNLKRPGSVPKWNKGTEIASWGAIVDFIGKLNLKVQNKGPDIDKIVQECKSKLYNL